MTGITGIQFINGMGCHGTMNARRQDRTCVIGFDEGREIDPDNFGWFEEHEASIQKARAVKECGKTTTELVIFSKRDVGNDVLKGANDLGCLRAISITSDGGISMDGAILPSTVETIATRFGDVTFSNMKRVSSLKHVQINAGFHDLDAIESLALAFNDDVKVQAFPVELGGGIPLDTIPCVDSSRLNLFTGEHDARELRDCLGI